MHGLTAHPNAPTANGHHIAHPANGHAFPAAATLTLISCIPSATENGSTGNSRLLQAVARGLLRQEVVPGTAAVKCLPVELLYDDAGLALFDEITRLPEYYLTNAELSIFKACGADIARSCVQDGSLIVELGAGSMCKTRLLLDAVERIGRQGVTFAALDLCETSLRRDLKALKGAGGSAISNLVGLVGTYEDGLDLLQQLRPAALPLPAQLGNKQPHHQPHSQLHKQPPSLSVAAALSAAAAPAGASAQLAPAGPEEEEDQFDTSLVPGVGPQLIGMQNGLTSSATAPLNSGCTAASSALAELLVGSSACCGGSRCSCMAASQVPHAVLGSSYPSADAGAANGSSIHPSPAASSSNGISSNGTSSSSDMNGSSSGMNGSSKSGAKPQPSINVEDFEYACFYNEALGRHEAYYKAVTDTAILLPAALVTGQLLAPGDQGSIKGGVDTAAGCVSVQVTAGELISIEFSYKYSPEEVKALAAAAGLSCVRSWPDSQQRYDLHLMLHA